jgi:CO/xanthine dehydrogenase FAD-binding subunit
MTLHGSFVRPKTLAEACEILADAAKRPILLAGGTDLVVEHQILAARSTLPEPRLVVDVSNLGELLRFEDRGATVRIGGGVTYLTLRRTPLLAAKLPLLAAMAKDVGAIQIQARGTLAGNLATGSPAADGVAALFALDAVIGLRSVRGERALPIAKLYTGYKKSERKDDEVIAWIDVRVPSPGARWMWRKVGTRLAQSISKVALAAVAEIDEGGMESHARFGMASVAPTTAHLPGVQRALVGQHVSAIDQASVLAALEGDISPIDDIRSTAAYRRHVSRALLRQFLGSLAPRDSVPPDSFRRP